MDWSSRSEVRAQMVSEEVHGIEVGQVVRTPQDMKVRLRVNRSNLGPLDIEGLVTRRN